MRKTATVILCIIGMASFVMAWDFRVDDCRPTFSTHRLDFTIATSTPQPSISDAPYQRRSFGFVVFSDAEKSAAQSYLAAKDISYTTTATSAPANIAQYFETSDYCSRTEWIEHAPDGGQGIEQ